MRQVGKRGLLWKKARAQWIKDNPPSFEGWYFCTYCHKAIDKYELTLDHVIARSKRPDLLTDQSNLVPACPVCNSAKGSL